jgi:hypothetical protein
MNKVEGDMAHFNLIFQLLPRETENNKSRELCSGLRTEL